MANAFSARQRVRLWGREEFHLELDGDRRWRLQAVDFSSALVHTARSKLPTESAGKLRNRFSEQVPPFVLQALPSREKTPPAGVVYPVVEIAGRELSSKQP